MLVVSSVWAFRTSLPRNLIFYYQGIGQKNVSHPVPPTTIHKVSGSVDGIVKYSLKFEKFTYSFVG
jgi:hypothetical protein